MVNEWKARAKTAERERDQALRDRDAAMDAETAQGIRAKEAERERDAANVERLAAIRVKGEMVDRAREAERERDVFQSRADTQAKRIDALLREREQVLCERDEWREKAEARATVTREDVDKVITEVMPSWSYPSMVVDTVCELFGIADQPDPVEAKAIELHEVAQGDGTFIVWGALDEPYRNRYLRMARHVLGSDHE